MAALLSVVASVKQRGIDPRVYLGRVLTELPARAPGTDLTDLLPDRWARIRSGTRTPAG